MIMPGRAANMGDGWEGRRRRGPGFDWCIVRLGTRGIVSRIEVDTNHFKGNYPDRCLIEVCDAPDAGPGSAFDPGAQAWRTLLPESKLQAHTRHEFEAELTGGGQPCTHARLSIFPDGGVSRLRLWGRPVA